MAIADAQQMDEASATSSRRLEALILGFGDPSGSMGMRFGHELDKTSATPAICGPPTGCA